MEQCFLALCEGGVVLNLITAVWMLGYVWVPFVGHINELWTTLGTRQGGMFFGRDFPPKSSPAVCLCVSVFVCVCVCMMFWQDSRGSSFSLLWLLVWPVLTLFLVIKWLGVGRRGGVLFMVAMAMLRVTGMLYTARVSRRRWYAENWLFCLSACIGLAHTTSHKHHWSSIQPQLETDYVVTGQCQPTRWNNTNYVSTLRYLAAVC